MAAKVYYNLQEYDESMLFALGAGKLFNLDLVREFEETIICTSSSRALRSEIHNIQLTNTSL